MSTFNLSQVTIPTPQPYERQNPSAQLENLSYVLLQMLSQAKIAEFAFNDAQVSLSVDVSGIETALRDLKYNGQVIDLGPFKIYLTSNTVSISP